MYIIRFKLKSYKKRKKMTILTATKKEKYIKKKTGNLCSKKENIL